jgi:hypothetical protein
MKEVIMKRNTLFAVVLSALLIAGMACSIPTITVGSTESIRGSGNVVEESRSISDFSSLILSGIGHVFIEQGQSEGLVIEAEENLIPYFENEVVQGKLEIGIREGINLRPREPVNFYLKVKNLEMILLSGSGQIEAEMLEAETLKLTLSGSGEIMIEDLVASNLKATLSGSGEIELGGDVEYQDLTISGSGDYRARDLTSLTADIVISGSGSAILNVDDQLDVTISGSGSVQYAGDADLSQSIPGSGSISHLDE